MYRLLEIGEVIESGDEWWDEGEWRVNNVVGLTYVVDIPLRRLVKPAVTPAASSVPAPVVSVGDRVKVLSGPWAGCTGVVTGFETQVSLSGYGKMTALRDSVPVVELDHVRVGGQRLTVKAGSLEKLPPVVPEVPYRDLAIGETIRQGDEFLNSVTKKWQVRSVGSSVPLSGYHVRHYRPVRVQSPGWRYLDAGETVQAGDEVWCHSFRHWERLTVLYDSPVNNDRIFRRKLPANVGG